MLRALILVAATTPILYGITAIASAPTVVEISGLFSGARVTLTPELDYLLKPFGIYVLMFGLLLAFTAIDPSRHRAIVIWAALLLVLRGVQRWVLADTLREVFTVPATRNTLHVAYLIALGGLLLVLIARETSTDHNGPPQGRQLSGP